MNKIIKYITIFFCMTSYLYAATPITSKKKKQSIATVALQSNKALSVSTPIQSALVTSSPSNVITLSASPTSSSNVPVPLPGTASSSQTPVGSNQNIDSVIETTLQQFFSVFPDPANPACALLPSLDKAVTHFYNDTLHLPPVVMDAIRRLYALMQGLVVDTVLQSEQQTINNLQQQIAIATSKKDPLLAKYQSQLTQAKNDYQSKKNGLDSSIIKLCVQSPLWQKYLKSLIASSFDYEKLLLSNVHDEEKQLFTYIPQFEVAYYTQCFQDLRINSEIVRVFLVITEIVRARAIAQSVEWSQIKDTSALYDAIQIFKGSADYFSQKSFTEATFGKATYPLSTSIKIVDASGVIAPGFASFFYTVKNNDGTFTLVPNQNLKGMLLVDQKTGNVSLTSFGNLLLQYQPAKGSTSEGLTYTSMFNALFTQGHSGYMPTPLYMTLVGFSGIKLLNNTLDYLFNTANLESTMAQLATIDQSFFDTFPIIISYQPSDYLYLDDINFLKAGAATPPTSSTANNGTAAPQGHSFTSAFTDFGHSFVGAMKQLGSALYTGVKIAGEYLKDWNMSLWYYDTGIACAVEGISYGQSLVKGGKTLIQSQTDIGDFAENFVNIQAAYGATAKATTNLVGSVIGQSLGVILGGGALGDDITGFINSINDATIDVCVDVVGMAASGLATLVQLAAGSLAFIAQAVVELAAAPFIAATGGTPFAGMDSMGSTFLKNMVVALLRPIKFMIKAVEVGLQGIMQGAAYLAGAILDLSINIAGGIAALNATVNGGDASAAFNNIQTSLNQHRRVIVSAISIAVLTIAGAVATVFTGGAAAGPLGIAIAASIAALSAGMMAMSTVGENQKDEEAITNKANQTDYLHKFSAYVTDNIMTSSFTQSLLVQDINSQLDDTLKNQERSLLYYQNYLNNSLNTSIQTSAYGLGSFYNQLLTPDSKTGLMYGDPGAVYGIQTNRVALNPSQGLTVYNSQRNSFAQEVGCMPTQVVADTQGSSVKINQSPTQFWINQKDLSMVPNGTALSAEIRWRTLYETQGAFYVGLFMSNQYIDANALTGLYNNLTVLENSTATNRDILEQQLWKSINDVNMHVLNFNNKGKALVIFRDALTITPSVGLYEHQGADWINKNIAPINYQTGVWYRMKMQINSNTAVVKCWVETDVEPGNWQGSFPVSMDPQYIYPAPMVAMPGSSQLSAPTNQEVTPANISLVADTGVGKQGYDSSQNSWIPYVSQSQQQQGAPKYAGSIGVIASGAAVEYQVITPSFTPVISAARKQSNAAVDAQFAKQGILPKEIDQEKSWMAKSAQLGNPITFGSFTLAPVSKDLISQGVFVYTTNQTGLANNDIDYVVFASSITKGASVGVANGLGVDPSENPQIIVSLVTGNAYDQTKQLIQPCNGVLALCQSSLGLPVSLIQAITAANTQYYASLATSILFANITLTGEVQAIQNGGFVYSGSSITKNLTGKDYFIAATINSAGLITPSHAYGQKLDPKDSTINGLVSLVTGQVFMYTIAGKLVTSLVGQDLTKVTIAPVANAPLYTTMLSNYSGLTSVALYQTIQQQSIAYVKAQPIVTVVPPTPPVVTPPQVSKPPLPTLGSLLGTPSTTKGSNTQNFNNMLDTGGF